MFWGWRNGFTVKSMFCSGKEPRLVPSTHFSCLPTTYDSSSTGAEAPPHSGCGSSLQDPMQSLLWGNSVSAVCSQGVGNDLQMSHRANHQSMRSVLFHVSVNVPHTAQRPHKKRQLQLLLGTKAEACRTRQESFGYTPKRPPSPKTPLTKLLHSQ